jgi:hypothetical protein
MRILNNTYMEVGKEKMIINGVEYKYNILYKLNGYHKIHIPITSIIDLLDIQKIANKIFMKYYLD